MRRGRAGERPRLRLRPETVARDDEILAVVGPPSDDDTDAGMLATPMVDRDPAEAYPQIPLGAGDAVPREKFDFRKLRRVFWRDDKAEMAPVLRESLRKVRLMDVAALGPEHASRFAILGHVVATEIGERGEKRRALLGVTSKISSRSLRGGHRAAKYKRLV